MLKSILISFATIIAVFALIVGGIFLFNDEPKSLDANPTIATEPIIDEVEEENDHKDVEEEMIEENVAEDLNFFSSELKIVSID